MSDRVWVEKIKEKASIIDIVGEYVRLRKVGSNFSGLCPFHAERTPSFTVSEKKRIYHCFGCQKGGDVFSFVQEIQNVSFPEAMQVLASRYQIPLPQAFLKSNPNTNSQEQDIYYKLNRFVAQFYHSNLLDPQHEQVRNYLKKRGISEKTIENAYLGYAPQGWDGLCKFLASKKAPLELAVQLGLLRKRPESEGFYDIFRNRLLFPITDTKGRIIAFGGRRLSKDEEGPKYLNSPESPIFKKGETLFGLFHAQKEIRAENQCVIVEGFMDCLMLQQEGIGHTVATLGTALTTEQAQILKRLTQNIIVVFDGDAAGFQAQSRAMEVFLEKDVVIKGVCLPDGLDPDEFIQKNGTNAFLELLKTAPSLLDKKIQDLALEAGSDLTTRTQNLEQVLVWVGKLQSPIARLIRLEEISRYFNLDLQLLEKQLRPYIGKLGGKLGTHLDRSKKHDQTNQIPPGSPKNTCKISPLERRFLEFLILHPRLTVEMVGDVSTLLSAFDSKHSQEFILKLWEKVKLELLRPEHLQEVKATKRDVDATKHEDTFREIFVDILEEISLEDYQVFLRELLLKEQPDIQGEKDFDSLKKELLDLKLKLFIRSLENKRDTLKIQIKRADQNKEEVELTALMKKLSEVIKVLDEKRGPF